MRRFLLGAALIAAFAVIGQSSARADIFLDLQNYQDMGGGVYSYTYDVTLSPGAVITSNGGGLNSANFFTVFDFNGYIAGSASVALPNTWSVIDSNNVSPPAYIPATQTPPDAPGIPNITFLYGSGQPNIASGLIGQVTLQSTNSLSQIENIFYSGASQLGSRLTTIRNNTSAVVGPVPEPTSLALCGLGLAGLVGACRLRRRA